MAELHNLSCTRSYPKLDSITSRVALVLACCWRAPPQPNTRSAPGGRLVGLIFWRYLRSTDDEFWHHVMVDLGNLVKELGLLGLCRGRRQTIRVYVESSRRQAWHLQRSQRIDLASHSLPVTSLARTKPGSSWKLRSRFGKRFALFVLGRSSAQAEL